MFTYVMATKPGYTKTLSLMLMTGLILILVGLGQANWQGTSSELMLIYLINPTHSKEIESFQVPKDRHEYKYPEKVCRNKLDLGFKQSQRTLAFNIHSQLLVPSMLCQGF